MQNRPGAAWYAALIAVTLAAAAVQHSGFAQPREDAQSETPQSNESAPEPGSDAEAAAGQATDAAATPDAADDPAASGAAPATADDAAAAGATEPSDSAVATDADVETLIRLLENEDTRAALIARLRAAESGAPDEVAATADTGSVGPVRAFAEYTSGFATSTVSLFESISALVREVSGIVTGEIAIDVDGLERLLLRVGLVVAATFGVYLVLRVLFRWPQSRLAGRAGNADLVRRIKLTGTSTLIDVASVLLAWAAGYVVALYAGDDGNVALEQSLFLNAFLLVELIKAGARLMLEPRWQTLRFAPLDDTASAYWYFWLSRLVSLVGYGLMFVAPLLASGLSPVFADAVRVLAMLAVLAIVVVIVLQNHASVRAHLMRRAATSRPTYARALTVAGRTWHIAAIAYLVGVYLVWLTDPDDALPFLLRATLESLVAVAIGLVLGAAMQRFAGVGRLLPADVKARLPLLEARLNAFVPSVLRVVRFIIAIGVVIAIAQAWHLIDFAGWIATPRGQGILASALTAGLILLAGIVLHLSVQSWIEYRLGAGFGAVVSARERTLLGLFRNAFTIALVVVVLMLVLSELGVNIGPLLAGAGVVGLAVGFGAQKLVQDVINGAFIQFEDTLNEGDVVTAGGITGVVERLTVRSVSLRSLDGTYHLIPFSSVDTVSNLMKHFSYHVAAIGVAYREDILEVKQAMEEAFERLKATPVGDDVLGEFEMQGLVEFGDSAIVVRARIKTLPGKQWALGRAYNEIVKQVFDERDIEIPFPHVTLYMGQDKQGRSPPLFVQADEPLLARHAAAPATTEQAIEDEREPGRGETSAAEEDGGRDGKNSRRAGKQR